MTPLFVAPLALIKKGGCSCLPRRWFNGLREDNGGTFTMLKAHYSPAPKGRHGPGAFPLRCVNDRGERKPLRWRAGSICPQCLLTLPLYRRGAAPAQWANLVCRGSLKCSLWKRIEGNINTVDGVADSSRGPFSLIHFFSFEALRPFSPFIPFLSYQISD